VADGTVRDDIGAEDLLHAITQLSQPVPGRGPEHNQRILAVLLDGLRTGATQRPLHADSGVLLAATSSGPRAGLGG